MYPALAVVDALGERADVLWVGAHGGMEQDLVSRRGLAFKAIPAAGLHGVGLRNLPGNMLRLLQGTLAARRIVRSFKPDVLFFTGGFVGGPAALAGIGHPKVTFVPDIEPALAQQLISRLADRICLPVKAAERYYGQPDKLRVTGYPTRFDGYRRTKMQAREQLGISPDGPVLLVLGGSKGARSINQAIWASLDDLLPVCQVLHVIGQRDWPLFQEQVVPSLDGAGGRYHPKQYLHETMADALAAADLAVSRAGASTLGEFPIFGLPAVLVPYPHAWRYQQVNASYLAEQGAAIVLADGRLNEELSPLLIRLLGQPDKIEGMAKAAAHLANPGAADRIAAEIMALADEEAGA